MRRATYSLLCFVLLVLAACTASRKTSSSVPPPASKPKSQASKAIYPEPEREAKPVPREKDPEKKQQEREHEREREDQPGEATAFYLLQRTGSPEGELPVERYIEAKRHASRMSQFNVARGIRLNKGAKLPAAQSSSDLGKWTQLGPGNIGGRTRSLVIDPRDPNVMYAGAVAGGVWKTTNGGRNWTPMSDLIASIGIGALALDPSNPDILYAGTGEYYTGGTRGNSIRGLGIFKSIDAGVTWNQLPFTANSAFYYTNRILVSPKDGNRIYAATYGGVWRSLDGGETWLRVLVRTSPNTGCQDLVIRTDKDTDHLFASCGTVAAPATAIFRTTDGASNQPWEEVFRADNMGRTSIALAPSNQDIIYAMAASLENNEYRGGLLAIWRSTSGGGRDSWEMRVNNQDSQRVNTVMLSNPRELFRDICNGLEKAYLNQGGYDNVIAVDPVDPEIVWTGGIDLLRSNDGGRNWGIASFWDGAAPMMSHADQHLLVFHPQYDGAGNQVLFNANDGGIYRTSNARAETATGPRAACRPYSTRVEWESLNNNYAVTQFYKGTIYPGGSLYFGGTQDNGTIRGSDSTGPNQWRSIRGGDGGFVAVDPTNPNTIYHSYVNLSIGRSTSGNTSFSEVTTGITEPDSSFQFIAPFVMDPSEPQRLYIGGRTLWRTENRGNNWAAASTAFSPALGTISTIAVSPSDPRRVMFGTSTGTIFYHSDALAADSSTQWESSRPRAGYLSQLTFHPTDANIAYATYSQFKSLASDQHVYMTMDGGVTWRGIDGSGEDSIPDIPVFDLVPDPLNPSTLYAGTDIGLFVSTNGGESWSRDQNPFANSVTTTVQIDRSRGTTDLYAFTMGRGVWRTTLPGSGTACEYKIEAAGPAFEAVGGTREFQVDTGEGCVWSAAPETGVATVASPATGKGPGKLRVTYTLNTTTALRPSSVFAQGTLLRLTQNAPLVARNNDGQFAPQVIGRVPYVGVQDTRGATTEATDLDATCAPEGRERTVWFRYVAAQTGTLEIGFQLQSYVRFGDAGGFINAFEVSPGGSVGSELACVVSPPDTNFITTRRARFEVTQGRSYLFQAGATGPAPTGGFLVFLAQFIQ